MSWLPKKNVVVPFDFSDQSTEAIGVALQMAADPSGVHVVYVLPELIPTEPGVIWATVDDASRTKHAEDAIQKAMDDAGYKGCTIQTEIGDPGQMVADYAASVHADLIVMPSHGRTGFKRILIGSVAERVVRLSHCPVLVLRQ